MHYDPTSVVGYRTTGPPACNCSRMYRTVGRVHLPMGANGIPMEGEWYSVPAGGECADGQSLGEGGCTWRQLRVRKVINATCMYARVDAHVEHHGEGCFGRCAQPRNTSSDCYMQCYENTVDHMTGLQLIEPWQSAFAHDEAAAGGCAPVAALEAPALGSGH